MYICVYVYVFVIFFLLFVSIQYRDENQIMYYETSAKESTNVNNTVKSQQTKYKYVNVMIYVYT